MFRIERPDGTYYFENGHRGAWGFYEFDFPERKCLQEDEPAWRSVDVKTIER